MLKSFPILTPPKTNCHLLLTWMIISAIFTQSLAQQNPDFPNRQLNSHDSLVNFSRQEPRLLSSPFVSLGTVQSIFSTFYSTELIYLIPSKNMIVAQGPYLELLDMSDLSSLKRIAYKDVLGYSAAVSLDMKYLYYPSYLGFNVVNISNLNELDIIFTTNSVAGVHVEQIIASELVNGLVYGLLLDGFCIYDASEPRDIRNITMVRIRDVSNITISKDENTLYVSGKNKLYVYDISIKSSPVLVRTLTSKSFGNLWRSQSGNILVSVEPSSITKWNLTNPLNPIEIQSYPGNFSKMPFELTEDTNLIFFISTEAYISVYDLSSSAAIFYGRIMTPNACWSIKVHPNQRNLVAACRSSGVVIIQLNNYQRNFADVHSIPSLVSTRPYHEECKSLLISDDNKLLFQGSKYSFSIYNISNISDVQSIGKEHDMESQAGTFQKLTPSLDPNIIYWSSNFYDSRTINLTNLTNPNFTQHENIYGFFFPSIDRKYMLQSEYFYYLFINISTSEQRGNLKVEKNQNEARYHNGYFFTSDGRKLINLDQQLKQIDILDISFDPKQPSEPLSSISLFATPVGNSPDMKYIYLVSADALHIYDISDIYNPFFVTKLFARDAGSFSMTSNGRIGFLRVYNGILVIDLAIPALPGYVYLIQTETSTTFALTRDEKNLITCGENMNIYSNKNEKFAVSLSSSYELGRVYSESLRLFKLDPSGSYNIYIESPYKISKISVNKVDFNSGNTQVSLPSFLSFDEKNSELNLKSTSQNDIGVYPLKIGISFHIPNSAFIGITNITTLSESQDLFAFLFLGNYIDSQGYLNTDFDPSTPLILSSQYINQEAEIRIKLSQYYTEIIQIIRIVSSMSVTISEEGINISSPSSLDIICTINLNSSQSQFIGSNFPALTSFFNMNSKVVISGTLSDVQASLRQLKINLENSKIAQASITISDGMNPDFIRNIPDISSYFKINRAPYLSVTFPEKYIVSGETETSIQLPQGAFQDPDGDPLTFKIVTKDGRSPPAWIGINGYIISTSAPDELITETFKIIATDGFKTAEATFQIKVNPSPIFWIELFLSIFGTLGSIIAAYIYWVLFLNIFTKKSYQIPKKFFIKGGLPCDSSNIFPVAFLGRYTKISQDLKEVLYEKLIKPNKFQKFCDIKKDLRLAKFFLKEKNECINYKKLVTQISQNLKEHQDKKGKENKRELLLKDCDSQVQIAISKAPLTEKTEHKSTIKISERREDLNSVQIQITNPKQAKHIVENICEKAVIFMIKYDLTKNLLESKGEAGTKKVFDSISSKWDLFAKIASKENELLPEVKISKEKLNLAVKTLEKQHQTVNIKLLSSALELEIQNWFCLKEALFSIELLFFESKPAKKCEKFLKLDLEKIKSTGKELGYGIEYGLHYDKLIFEGIVDDDIEGKNLVLQILNSNGRILREIKIFVDEKSEEKNCLISKNCK